MGIPANSVLTFTGYEILDEGLRPTFSAALPSGPTDYSVSIADTDLAAVTTSAQLRTLVTAALNRKLRATNIAAKLDALIGQTVTI